MDLLLKSEVTDTFSEEYARLNNLIFTEAPEQASRYGHTRELLQVKLELSHPESGVRRCTGGYERNINVFFLLAESLWIWAGRKDVKFLTIFNSRMVEFSDDGVVFHAPYGWRLRHWGQATEQVLGAQEEVTAGYDQLKAAIIQLGKNLDSRRVVMSIWDPKLDLEKDSKDLPCNDLVLVKVRKVNGEYCMLMTIQNRSNDLHWGLPTNVFQFSFLGELMAAILGVRFSTQVHNIDSLHLYTDNPIANSMFELYNSPKSAFEYFDLYQYSVAKPMDFSFKTNEVTSRMVTLDNWVLLLLNGLEEYQRTGDITYFNSMYLTPIKRFSLYFYVIGRLLQVYVQYTHSNKKDVDRVHAIECILRLADQETEISDLIRLDVVVLALNFFTQRVKNKELLPAVLPPYMGKL